MPLLLQEELEEEVGGEEREARNKRQTEIEGMVREMREMLSRRFEEVEEIGGRVLREDREREGPRERERPGGRRQQETSDVVKGDLSQRKLFSDVQRQGGFFDQNTIAEKKTALMDKLRGRRREPVASSSVPSPNNGPIKLFLSHEQTSRGQRMVRGVRASSENGFPLARDFEVDLGDFNPEAYLAGQHLKEGEDEMKRFQFNQRRSDGTPYNRELKDVRNPRYIAYTLCNLSSIPPSFPLQLCQFC